jgi:hypothetical protein
MSIDKANKHKFTWRGLDLHLGRSKTPVLTLVQDGTYPHLYRIVYPNGWMSTPANLTRAKDAAYGHARYLLGAASPQEAFHSPEDDLIVPTMPDQEEAA